ncbi:MAG TPA: L,D-transpeptidase family protein [Longimicrobiaceae bacterium]|nr:L,D-transpeptidase family protein [Longimicrobiaceae bacterium]
MIGTVKPHLARALCAAVLLAAPGGCATLSPGADTPEEGRRAEAVNPGTDVRPDGKYVLVDLDLNQLRFMDGERVLWWAHVGTGTGFRLTGDDEKWHFSTPNGIMHVQFKELDPVWIVPDWYYIENKLPIPPADSPRRKQPGGLGVAAVYLGNEIAIHGTDKPELLGLRVSHGCIRLANEYALRLFHNVQVGTPVVIRGGPKEVAREQPDSVASFTRQRSSAAKKPVNPLARVSTASLLARLEQQLKADTTTRWHQAAAELIARGLKDDADALRGVLALAGAAPGELRREEYATFLADAFARGSLRAVVSLARIDREAREEAARSIVRATMTLYHGSPDDPTAPWPTRRVPKWRLGPSGQAGWEALQEAEAVFRAGRNAPALAAKSER